MADPGGASVAPDESLFDLLSGANLTAERMMMEDGYPSFRMRSAEEAAALALDTLRAAGYEVVRASADSAPEPCVPVPSADSGESS